MPLYMNISQQRQGWNFSLLPVIQTHFVAHIASYPMYTGAVTPEVKRSGREADHLSPSNDEVKNS